ncbi:MAG: hypothetical protein N2200_01445 [Bacteroidia bacterium]|nr:hypothetical protein [Bacteroidia bacterium]
MRWILIVGVVLAQDTLRFMAYNLLRYGATPGYCNTACKDAQLRTIVGFLRPSVLGVNEIAPASALIQRVLDSVLNVNGVSYWRSSTYANPSGSDIVNALFYDSRRLEWIKQELVTTQGGLRDIYAYHLYYKEPAPIIDTLFVVVIVSHLKAGNAASDSQSRAQAGNAIKQYIQSLPAARRRFVVDMGDHNLYSGSEVAYQNITAVLVDPAPAGPWSGNAAYAYYHTQSTRTAALADGGTSGGLDDRFDFIFFSPECTTSTARARYIPGTFKVVGQDGQRFNQAINSTPLPAGYPVSVINALYAMSDHLPVVADFALSVTPYTTSVEKSVVIHTPCLYEIEGSTLYLTANAPCQVEIWNLRGEMYLRLALVPGQRQEVELPMGVYLLRAGEGFVKRIGILP